MSSNNFSNLAPYYDAVKKIAPELISRLFCTNTSAQISTGHEGLKGSKILTELILGDLAFRWAKEHNPRANTFDYQPRELSVSKAKADFSVCPQEYEDTYHAYMRRTGQNPKDWPFQAFILMKVIEKLQSEINVALWQAEKADVLSDDHKLELLFDGWIRNAFDAVDATDLSLFAPAGTSWVDDIEAMEDALDNCLFDQPGNVECYLPVSIYRSYIRDYRERFGKYVEVFHNADKSKSYMTDNGTVLRPMTGMNDEYVMMTFKGNLHHGYDAAMDERLINLEYNKRVIDGWIDFNIGTQIGIARDGVMVFAEV